MRHCFLALSLIGAVGLFGCSKSAPSTAPAAAGTPATATPGSTAAQPAPQPIAVPASATPDQVVQVFLQALRTGDSATTESLLTARARTELAKHEMHVDVQAAPNAVYQVEPATQMPNEPTVAHVNSLWTERYADDQGQPVEEKYGIVWGLRHQPEGWRVAGMQVELVPGLRQYLDFENPEDMLKKREEALAAAQQMAAPEAATAANGAASGQVSQQAQAPQPQQATPVIDR